MPGATTYHNALPSGAMLHEYRLQSVLGAGAFGLTYLASDTHLDKDVAIKEYLPTALAVRALDGSVLPVTTGHVHDYQWGLNRFLLEARTLARFSHPNIVRVSRYFEAHGTAYMVMDFERGASLAQLLRSEPAPDEARLRALLAPLLDALEAVHDAGFLHRDIKPANVFIRANGVPLLLDFGAARQALGDATRSLTAVLTPGYAPLEQYARDGNQGPWSDIYALAGVAYRVLTGENPPEAVSRLADDVVPRKLGAAAGRAAPGLLKAVEWALSMDEKLRPRSVPEWRRAVLGQAQAPGLPATGPGVAVASVQPARRPAAGQGTGKEGKRWPPGWRWAAAAVILALVVAWIADRGRQSQPGAPAGAPPAREAVPGPARSAPEEARVRADVPDRPPRERGDRPYDEERDLAQLQKRALHEFRAADTDGDGFLSRDEGRRFPVLAKAFERVDTDGDGRISPQEFVSLRRQQAQQQKPK